MKIKVVGRRQVATTTNPTQDNTIISNGTVTLDNITPSEEITRPDSIEILDETAPPEKEEILDETAPPEKEEILDETVPLEKEEILDETVPPEKEEILDETVPPEKEEILDETVPLEKEENLGETIPAKKEESLGEKIPWDKEEILDETTPLDKEENLDNTIIQDETEISDDIINPGKTDSSPYEPDKLKVTSVSIEMKPSAKIKVGERVYVVATLQPDDVTNKTLMYSSDNNNVAVIDEDGAITGIDEGSAIIRVTAANGVYAEERVVVAKSDVVPISLIKLDKEEVAITVSSTTNVFATIEPANATNKTISWISENPAIVTVDANGDVVGVGEGTTKITAIANDGSGCTASCVVNVIKNSIMNEESDLEYESLKSYGVIISDQKTIGKR